MDSLMTHNLDAIRDHVAQRLGDRVDWVHATAGDLGYMTMVAIKLHGAQLRHAVGMTTAEWDDEIALADHAADRLSTWIDESVRRVR